MKTTFINNNSEGNLRKIGYAALKSTAEDIQGYMKHGSYLEDIDEDNKEAVEFFDDMPDFNNYGLSVDRQHEEDETGDIIDGNSYYLRFQMSWGGPSDEVRFHWNGSRVTMVEYVYMDWFCGVGFDITGEDWGQWLSDHFVDCGYFENAMAH